jgi:lysyl-tRNA synthetase class II
MKAIIEGLLPRVCEKVLGQMTVEFGETKEILDFTPPYREVPYYDLVKDLMGADWFDLSIEDAKVKAEAKGLEIEPEMDHLLIWWMFSSLLWVARSFALDIPNRTILRPREQLSLIRLVMMPRR